MAPATRFSRRDPSAHFLVEARCHPEGAHAEPSLPQELARDRRILVGSREAKPPGAVQVPRFCRRGPSVGAPDPRFGRTWSGAFLRKSSVARVQQRPSRGTGGSPGGRPESRAPGAEPCGATRVRSSARLAPCVLKVRGETVDGRGAATYLAPPIPPGAGHNSPPRLVQDDDVRPAPRPQRSARNHSGAVLRMHGGGRRRMGRQGQRVARRCTRPSRRPTPQSAGRLCFPPADLLQK